MEKSPGKDLQQCSSKQQITDFLQRAEQLPVQAKKMCGRLMFAIDATASRQPSWDRASHLQAEMFLATDKVGGLAVQLCYYRGFNEFYHSAWCFDSKTLLQQMSCVQCLGGHTQIKKVLSHAVAECKQQSLNALVFVGDALEENIDDLCQLAGQLGVLQCPVFVFQEGYDAEVACGFKQVAKLSGGAYQAFNESSASELAALLSAVAVYATGGHQALLEYAQLNRSVAKTLLAQLAR